MAGFGDTILDTIEDIYDHPWYLLRLKRLYERLDACPLYLLRIIEYFEILYFNFEGQCIIDDSGLSYCYRWFK